MLALFTRHPGTVGETYLNHAWFALGFSFWLIVAAFAALIHAIFPFACETTASRIIGRLAERTHARVATPAK